MQVNRRDGTCRSCDGTLTIIAADDATMEVACTDCGETYLVETDAFNDGGMHYSIGFLAQQVRKGGKP